MSRRRTEAKWEGSNGEIARHVLEQNEQTLRAYAAQPMLVRRDVGIERSIAQGGYERRQLFELVQNGADAMVQRPGGRIAIVLTDETLYCANQGDPLDREGATNLLLSHLSAKRGSEIGRFGVGFKSVLAVTEAPEFYSRSVSLVFDSARARALIGEVVPDLDRYPSLRLAFPVDPGPRTAGDPLLAALMDWADTVVRLPLKRRAPDLVEGIDTFPAEFLLFSPHVGELSLQNSPRGTDRILALHGRDGALALSDGRATTLWRVFSDDYAPSPEARAEAGELAERERLPLHWAVPVDGGRARGEFWAFFPTTWSTTLRGILNCAWKTNEDRQNLLQGKLNTELLDQAGILILGSLPLLVSPVDPARYLDVLPARGKSGESPNWADAELAQRFFNLAGYGPSLPDLDGKLRKPSELRLHPRELPREALELWAAVPGRSADWCHWSIDQRDRRSRAERIYEHPKVATRPATVHEWLDALLEVETTEAFVAAVRIAALLVREGRAPAQELKVVRTTTGALVAPLPDRVFLAASDTRSVPSVDLVDVAVAASPLAVEALEELGIRRVDPRGELESYLRDDPETWASEDWARFWELTRQIEPESVAHLIRERRLLRAIQVRTLAGSFRRLSAALLPGPVVPPDGSRDALVAIDTSWHNEDLRLLELLGATASPVVGANARNEPWFNEYRREQQATYERATKDHPHRANMDYLDLLETETVGSLQALRDMSEQGRAALTEIAISEAGALDEWTLRHRTVDTYPDVKVPSPVVWMVRRYGVVPTSLGPKSFGHAVSSALHRWADVFPVADLRDDVASSLRLPGSATEIDGPDWDAAFWRAAELSDRTRLGSLCAWACRSGVSAPEQLPCRLGDGVDAYPLEAFRVTADAMTSDALLEEAQPHLLTQSPAEAEDIAEKWSVAGATLGTEVRPVGGSTPASATDLFPGLRLLGQTPSIEIVVSDGLELDTYSKTGKRSRSVEVHFDGTTLFIADGADRREVLRHVLNAGGIELDDTDQQRLLDFKPSHHVAQRKRSIRDAPDDASRLLAALGVDRIRTRLPQGLFDAVADISGGNIHETRIAELAIAVHGVDVLRVYRDEFEELELAPPSRWAGSPQAREFVRQLGFPVEYAGFPADRLEPLLRIEGPPDLAPLHDFQRTIAHRARALLQRSNATRGLLSLPTGAGKTRIVIQALIEAMREDGLTGPIIWIAQTEELCEQAVQTWTEAWRAIGPRTLLSVSRLWAGNDAAPVDEGVHVLVATIDKLRVCRDNPAYEWLASPTCVVVDEAHRSITTEYTGVLDWMGLGRSQRQDRCPLIGLTATPFRGRSEEETKRLVSRYGSNRLDADVLGDEPYASLQKLGVLAHVEHRLLRGSDIELTDAELRETKEMRRLPGTVEARLGNDVGRNRELLESIGSLPDDMTALLFAASVDHAQTMAALLSDAGIPAKAITGGTETGARRHYIEHFRTGDLRVLTNYAVLTQGFDAPAVGAVYVARPTFSPTLYQQMIGRGLRGPLNGGKKSCLIVNVQDNLEQYGEALAFREFEHLWTAEDD